MSSNSETLSVTCRFERDPSSPVGLMSAHRASTDAMSVVANWELRAQGRSYDVLRDEDDLLVVSLQLRRGDEEAAGHDLDGLCIKYGVRQATIE